MKKSILLLTLLTSFSSFGHNTGTDHTGTENLPELVRSLIQKAEQGDAEAQYKLAYLYYDDVGIEKNELKFLEWMEKAAKQGHAEAQYKLGSRYLNGKNYSTFNRKNAVKAFGWMKRAAEQGHAKAQYITGTFYKEGIYIWELTLDNGKLIQKDTITILERDIEKAYEWYKKALEQGYEIPGYYLSNHTGTENLSESVRSLMQKAENGDAEAQHQLSYRYFDGNGVEKSEAKTAEWAERAAEQGHAEAQYGLGYLYKYGVGVTKNYEASAKWYKRAAEQGHSSAQNSLGNLYKNGLGVEKNIEKAIYWFNKAVDQGNEMARQNLRNL